MNGVANGRVIGSLMTFSLLFTRGRARKGPPIIGGNVLIRGPQTFGREYINPIPPSIVGASLLE
jgi:hypothetical protein